MDIRNLVWQRWAVVATVFLGIFVRLWQYVSNPSIWVDEAAIARNVLDRQPLQLFQPLDYAQLAPPGFLFGVKLSAAAFGSSEYALRLFPIAAGVVSVVLFFFVAQVVLRPFASIVATFMFSTAIPLIFFSSNLKQYSSDVAITLFVILIALELHRSSITDQNIMKFALAPVILLFFSQAAIFSLAASGAVIFFDAFISKREDWRRRFVIVLWWATAVLIAIGYSFFSITSADNAYLHNFWAHAFLPETGWGGWLWNTAQRIFAGSANANAFDGSLSYMWPGLFTVLFIYGSVIFIIKKPIHGSLIIGPLLLPLLASAAQAYPFGTRVSLFLLPLILIILVAGADDLGRLLIPHQIGQYIPGLLLPFAVFAFSQQLPPRTQEHLRPVIQYVSDHWESEDSLWVYYGAGQAFEYYRKLIPISGDIHIGDCNRSDPRAYLHQVDVERGRTRVWILMAHGSGAFGFDERNLIITYLETIGLKIDEIHAPLNDLSAGRAAAYLFDLSDPEKLAVSSAKEFPIQNDFQPQAWTCYGTMSPFGASEWIIGEVMNRNIS